MSCPHAGVSRRGVLVRRWRTLAAIGLPLGLGVVLPLEHRPLWLELLVEL